MVSPILLGVSVAIALVCACLAIVSTRKSLAALDEMRRIASSLRTSLGKIEAHDSELENLADSFRTLRGKFYAERRKNSENGPEADSGSAVDRPGRSVADLKAQLRKKVGLVPGRVS